MPTAKSLCLAWQIELKGGSNQSYNREQMRALTMHIVECAECRVLGQIAAEHRKSVVQGIRDGVRRSVSRDTYSPTERRTDTEGEALSPRAPISVESGHATECTCGTNTACSFHG